MFIVIEYGGSTGHSSVLLTGLGKKSCFLHYTGTSYLKGLYARNHHVGDFSERVCIPSLEDGNEIGLSETLALHCWRFYKHVLHRKFPNRWETSKDGRNEVFNFAYNNYSNNCTNFANDLLAAASDGEYNTTWFNFQAGFSSNRVFAAVPGVFTRKARWVRDDILEKIKKSGRKPVYGLVLESELLKRSKGMLKHFWPTYTPDHNVSYSDISGSTKKTLDAGLTAYDEVPWRDRSENVWKQEGGYFNDAFMDNLETILGEGSQSLQLVSRNKSKEAPKDYEGLSAQFRRFAELGIKPLGYKYTAS
ncbi:hypothetical protein [Archangium lipolyticum]|uniref:hypothetical protein n=1 Tax=Archangium lipolyticum TaxID=2970465 RepID=UPI00214A794E|nr:hypothetical protein [Archangium lipolyticum]